MTKVMDMRMNELLLLQLLDQKELPESTKKIVRNIMAPSIEAIENCHSPEEVLNTTEMLLRMIVPVIVMGIEASIIPEKVEEVFGMTRDSFYRDLITHRAMYHEALRLAEEAKQQ